MLHEREGEVGREREQHLDAPGLLADIHGGANHFLIMSNRSEFAEIYEKMFVLQVGQAL